MALRQRSAKSLPVSMKWVNTFPDVSLDTVYPKKYAHGFCFAVLCCGYTLTDFPISIRLTSLALWQSNDCPSASKATLMNMDKYFMWIHYERLHNHNKAKHNKTVCIFLGIYCNKVTKKKNNQWKHGPEYRISSSSSWPWSWSSSLSERRHHHSIIIIITAFIWTYFVYFY